MTLSLCVIVKNEAEQIKHLIINAKDYCDEIIIVDTGSTDHTREVVKNFGLDVFTFPWNNNFAAARNFSLSRAIADWILVLDADEIITREDGFSIKQLISTSPDKVAYMLNTRNYDRRSNLEGWVPNTNEYPLFELGHGWTKSTKTRLFPNHCDIYFTGIVHELVEYSLKELGFTIEMCNIPVHHYGKLDIAKTSIKERYYYDLGVKKLIDNPNDIVALYELAIQSNGVGKFTHAKILWEKYLNKMPHDAKAWFNYSYTLLRLGLFQESIDASDKTLSLDISIKEAYFNKMNSLILLNKLDECNNLINIFLTKYENQMTALILLSITNILSGRIGNALEIVNNLPKLNLVKILDDYRSFLLKHNKTSKATKILDFIEELRRRK